MLREQSKLISKIAQFIDLTIIFLSFILAYCVRDYLLTLFIDQFSPLLPLDRYLRLLFVSLLLWWILLRLQGFYDPLRAKSLASTSWIIIKTALMVTLGVGTFIFSFKFQYISRTFIFIFVIISILLLIAEQFILKLARKRRNNYREVLIVGTERRLTEIAQKIMKYKEWGLKISGFVGNDPEMVGGEILGIKVIGTLNDIPKLIKEKVIDEVIFSVPKSWLGDLEPSIYACEEAGINVKLTLNFFDPLIARYSLDDLDGIPLLAFSTTPRNAGQLLIKQIFDTTVSFLLLILLAPLFLIVALIIKISSPGPVFFKQRRCGLNRREFTLYKFRSMVADAEKIKTQLEKFNEADGLVFKIKNDPRITPIGKFIRKTSIDELPQVFNVLKGDMSLVGPRPPLPSEVKKYERQQQRRLSMKPGITCIWQTSGRNKVNFDTWIKMDLEYIDNWSLGLDFKILLKTIPAVLFGKGAM